VVVVDANVLLYAVNRSSSNHESARRWLERALNGDEPVGMTWMVLLAFVRISTLAAFAARPLSAADAFGFIDDWAAAPAATIVQPTSRHAGVLRSLVTEAGTAGNLTNDAHLAAIAIEHSASVCTFDRDFQRFAGVRVVRPER
jgi:toxin-antitoxin system PIN domain toxin